MHMKPVQRLLVGDDWLYQHMQHRVMYSYNAPAPSANRVLLREAPRVFSSRGNRTSTTAILCNPRF
ncbi:unnamed protein product [Ectocarpus sp. 6 AP-2014]